MKLFGVRKHIGPWGWMYFNEWLAPRQKVLLTGLSIYTDPILVTGCQRSGTTIVTRLVRECDDVAAFPDCKDDELFGARVLAGLASYPAEHKRVCFQSTYLNDRYSEYFRQQKPFSLVWLLRNPYDVVGSMVYNWKRYPLYDLFRKCGLEAARSFKAVPRSTSRAGALSAVEKASFSYVGKLRQLDDVIKNQSKNTMCKLIIAEYEAIAGDPVNAVRDLFSFLSLEFEDRVVSKFSGSKLAGGGRLSASEMQTVQTICEQPYMALRAKLPLMPEQICRVINTQAAGRPS